MQSSTKQAQTQHTITGLLADPARPGGDLLLIRESGTAQDRQMPFAYAKQFMNDAVWFGKASSAT